MIKVDSFSVEQLGYLFQLVFPSNIYGKSFWLDEEMANELELIMANPLGI